MARNFPDLASLLRDGRDIFAKGPVGLILVEDAVEYASTLRHHLDAGFKALAVFAAPGLELPEFHDPRISRIACDTLREDLAEHVVNACIKAAPAGTWLYYCYNAEYLFHPFCEHRNIAEMLTFCTEERRDSVLTYVVDLYAGDLTAHPSAVSIEDAHLDRAGYYALARKGPNGHPAERQLDFYGGLRWRFEEYISPAKRRIDRISLFRTRPGLTLLSGHLFNEAEYNTYACPWHNSLTAAIGSFRTAKALKRNPGSSFSIHSFRWHNSEAFGWHSQQLLNIGLMEPGQWF